MKGRPEHNWVWSPQGVIDMHRPERWGYLQFSTATPGTAPFRPDPTAAARDLLHRVYYAQRDYRKANGKYAASPADLGLSAGAASRRRPAGSRRAPTWRGDKKRRVVITHDARVAVE